MSNTVEIMVNGLSCESEKDSMTMNGLNGLDDWRELTRYVNGVNASVPRIQEDLKLTEKGATDVLKLANQAIAVSPESVLTEEGANYLIAAGKKAQATARLMQAKSRDYRRDLIAAERNAKRARNATERAKAQATIAAIARELLAAQVSGQRALGVGAAVVSAVKFRRLATRERDEAKRRQLFGSAAAAVAKGQQIARTKVKLDLPEDLSDENIRRLAQEGGAVRQNSGPSPLAFPAVPRRNEVRQEGEMGPDTFHVPGRRVPSGWYPQTRGGAVPPFPGPTAGVRHTGQFYRATNLPSLPGNMPGFSQPTNGSGYNLLATEPQVTGSLSGLGGLGELNVGSLIGDIFKVGASVLPAILGGGAAPPALPQGVPQQPFYTPAPVQWGTQYPPQYMGPEGNVNATIIRTAGQISPPGMEQPQGGLPSWALPAGIAAVAVIAGLILI